ncbi:response regulator transcription factor [Roseibium denhamense]|uniref:Two-component system, OmpR family, response regulator TctD n=1 Tax=Roseibium denhamense TaxID=76305 RepID=A0ABY1NH63_9HYPH|nr:response regulator transcription factor [Roseibium denhamense]SMP08989.1 two-component system, OmpR family, response regulator TctD [Roseibium denhamense]
MRLLLVEDTFDMAEAIMIRLDRSGVACDLAKTLAEARACVDVQRYDVIVLDINLPDGRGTDLLKDLRSVGDRTPVLMLTAEFSVDDRVSSLNSGADDYLVKPFDHRELEARIRALYRRDQGDKAEEVTIGALIFNATARVARNADGPLNLTRREFSLLELLVRNRGQTMSKERLFEGLFSFDDTDVSMNALELYVARLRKKLSGCSVRIETQRGLGYKLEADA